ncbi:Chemotaxis protein [Halorhabdus tiamatea SARL4B]|uniref:Chemotaxis protein n=1 Tax=Halorhabdus tiamatea SARL4B TaxID=1033806 RepID=F7PIW8_9EURY|nr:protein-glutamate O-methyltransferase CheR [Halorhabdus tiamatea]ERJ05931.1 Chemotaxis protein [Halorhabdus tiamatea SARL4B]CCQ32934.1 chemotaxis protein CheR--methyltransferase [Halorhabdus tiamatea SARL4B]
MSRRSGSQRGFTSLLEYIGSELDFESDFYNDAYLDRRITARIRRTDSEDYRAYERLLRRDATEQDALLDSLSINVTGFFRNPEAWERLRPVLRELTEQRRTVRVWSAPCADGREPYSLAMLARDDPEIDERRLDILATDINPDILAEARAGVYETSQTTDIEAELEPLDSVSPYIDRDGDTFTVRESIREMVTFEQHDLIRGDPKGEFDLMLCRNFLIYIDSSYKEPIFETISDSLRSGGSLMIGMTETIPSQCRMTFDSVDKQRRIYTRV